MNSAAPSTSSLRKERKSLNNGSRGKKSVRPLAAFGPFLTKIKFLALLDVVSSK